MISERILQLLAKQMGHVASEKEITEFQELLQQHPEHGFLLEILQSIEGEKLYKEPILEEVDLVQESWHMLRLELDNLQTTNGVSANEIPVKKKLARMWVGRAAVWGGILLLASSFFFIFKQGEKKNVQHPIVKITQIRLPYGAPMKKILPDGSEVWLNAGSHIRYDDNFIQKNREVYLDGEAYFSVKHDASHPFIVHAGNITIRDLGTKFNVQAYPDENKIETTLISGRIMVKIDGKPDQSIILIPNEKLTVKNEIFRLSDKNIATKEELSFEVEKVVQIPSIASIPEVAWVQDQLVFENELFEELAKRMERRYNVQIIFKDTSLDEERLSGVFENENIQKAMNLLQMTTPFHYQIQGDTVVYLSR